MEKENRLHQRHWFLNGISSFKEGLFSKLGKRPSSSLHTQETCNGQPATAVISPPANGHPPDNRAPRAQSNGHQLTLNSPQSSHAIIPKELVLKKDLKERYGFPSLSVSINLAPPPSKHIRLSSACPNGSAGEEWCSPSASRCYQKSAATATETLHNPNGFFSNPLLATPTSSKASATLNSSEITRSDTPVNDRRIRLSSERRFNPYKPPASLFNNPLWNYSPGDLTRADQDQRLTPFTARNQKPLFPKTTKNYDIASLKRYKDYMKRVQEEEGMKAGTGNNPHDSSLNSESHDSLLERKLHRLRDIIRNFPTLGRGTGNSENSEETSNPLSPGSVADQSSGSPEEGDRTLGSSPSASRLFASTSPISLVDLTRGSSGGNGKEPHKWRSTQDLSIRQSRDDEGSSGTGGESPEPFPTPVEGSVRRKSSAEAMEAKWRSEKYRDEQQRNAMLIRQFEDEVEMRGKARLNRQIYNQEQLRAQLKLEGLLLERPVSKRDDFPPLSDEALDIVASAWDTYARRDEVIVTGFDVDIRRSDLMTFAGAEWLNDEVINFYMNLLVQRSQKSDGSLPRLYAFSTFFYPNLVNKGYASVKRWTKKVDVFAHELLIVPVHLTMHWCLCTVDFKQRLITYYDSLRGDNDRCLALIKDYLQQESLDKKKKPFSLEGWTTLCRKDIPRQMNGSDCGMFSCRFAEYASRRAPINFNQSHMPYFRQRTVFEICRMKLL